MSADWVPAAFAKADGSHASTQEAAAALMDETNRKFGSLGVSVSAQHRPGSVQGKQIMCGGCGKLVSGRVLEVMGQQWHPDCFTCSQCNQPFDLAAGTLTVRDNLPWCKKCVDWDAKLNGSGSAGGRGGAGGAGGHAGAGARGQGAGGGPSPFSYGSAAPSSGTGGAKTVKVQSEAQMAAHARIQEGKESCVTCGELITGKGVGMPGSYFHPDCFLCYKCEQPCYDGFLHKDDHIWHEACWAEVAPNCPRCGKMLVGKMVRTPDGVKYHKACFTCSGCNGDLSGGFLIKYARPYCGPCAATAAPPEETTITTAADGIRFNQQTREVRTAAPAPTPTPEPAAAASSGGKKFCTECGTAVSAKFCGNCGHKL